MKALDKSFSRITPEWAQARLAEGYELLIQDLWTGNAVVGGAEASLRIWREAGGRIAAYFCIHDATDIDTHFAKARYAAGLEWEYLEFLAIDVEIEPCSVASVLYAADLVLEAGLKPVVYTGYWFWAEKMGNPSGCEHLPLWDASHGIDPSLEMSYRYGNWSQRAIHQFQGTTNLDGVDVDLNLVDDALLKPLGGPQRPEREQLADILGGWGQRFLSGPLSPQESDQAAYEVQRVVDAVRAGKVQV